MLELYFLYYWNVTRYNLVLSALIMTLSLSFVNGMICFGSFGIPGSFLAYRYFHNIQYLFYLNAGFSKKRLMLTTAFINILISIITILIIT
jgi:hypothetical protein